jgi:uncharacterized phage-like protein YoqJ
MIIAGTGHRPDKLGGYGWDIFMRLTVFAQHELDRLNPDSVISGMALGWDLALTHACVQRGIPFIAAVPFNGQAKRWNVDWVDHYLKLLDKAKEVVVVSEGGYAPWKMHKRNEWMVDHCDKLLALWDGVAGGGTFNCVQYANKVGRPVDNCWERWKSWTLV